MGIAIGAAVGILVGGALMAVGIAAEMWWLLLPGFLVLALSTILGAAGLGAQGAPERSPKPSEQSERVPGRPEAGEAGDAASHEPGQAG